MDKASNPKKKIRLLLDIVQPWGKFCLNKFTINIQLQTTSKQIKNYLKTTEKVPKNYLKTTLILPQSFWNSFNPPFLRNVQKKAQKNPKLFDSGWPPLFLHNVQK